METILCLLHTDSNGALPKLALETLTAAVGTSKNMSGSKLIVGLIGNELNRAVDQIGGTPAQKFLSVSGPEFSVSRYATDALAVETLVRTSGATVILAPGTSRFARTIPGVAGRLSGCVDTHVSGVNASEGELKVQRWYYRQRLLATFSRKQRPWFLVLDSGVFPAWQSAGSAVKFENVTPAVPESLKRTKVTGFEAASHGAQTIRPDAKLLFVAGAGWTKKQADGKPHVKEAADLILGFLDKTQSSLGSSKSLVDQSGEGQEVLPFMSHLNQVGQTGSTPRHPKGLSACCHGEEPHVVGWRFINERRAINLDANCGWAQGKADVVYVGDAFQIVSKVNELLSK